MSKNITVNVDRIYLPPLSDSKVLKWGDVVDRFESASHQDHETNSYVINQDFDCVHIGVQPFQKDVIVIRTRDLEKGPVR